MKLHGLDLSFESLIKSIQAQLILISKTYATHPDPDRFGFAMARAIEALELDHYDKQTVRKARNGLNAIILDPHEIDFEELVNFDELGWFLRRNKLKLSRASDNSGSLLYINQIHKLLRLFNYLCTCIMRHDVTVQQSELHIQLALAKELFPLGLFSANHLMQLWKSDPQHINVLKPAVERLRIVDYREMELPKKTASLIISNMFAQPDKAAMIKKILERFYYKKDFMLPLESMLQTFLKMTNDEFEEVMYRFDSVNAFYYFSNLPADERRMLQSAIFDCVMTPVKVEDKFANIDSKKIVSYPVNTAALQRVMEFNRSLENCYKEPNEEDNDRDEADRFSLEVQRLIAYSEAALDTVVLLEDDLCHLIRLIDNLENPPYRYIDLSIDKSQAINAVVEQIREANFYEMLFGANRSLYFRDLLKAFRADNTGILAAFVVDPQYLIGNDEYYFISHAMDDWLTLGDVRILKPFIESNQPEKARAIGNGMEWLRRYNLRTPSRVQQIIDCSHAMHFLTDIRVVVNNNPDPNATAKLALQLFNVMLPLMKQMSLPEAKAKVMKEIDEKAETSISQRIPSDDAFKLCENRVIKAFSARHELDLDKNDTRIYLDNGNYVRMEYLKEYHHDSHLYSRAYSLYAGKTNEIIGNIHVAEHQDYFREFANNRLVTRCRRYVEGDRICCHSPENYFLNIWDLATQACIKSIDVGSTNQLMNMMSLSPDRLAYLIGNELTIYNVTTNKCESVSIREKYATIIGETPIGILLQDERGLILVDDEMAEHVLHQDFTGDHAYFLLDDKSILCFSAITQCNVLSGYGETFLREPVTMFSRLVFDKVNHCYSLYPEAKTLDHCIPKACYLRDDSVLLFETDDPYQNPEFYMMDLNVADAESTILLKCEVERSGHFHSSLNSDGLLFVRFKKVEWQLQLNDLKKCLVEHERLRNAGLSKQVASMWGRKSSLPTIQEEAVEQLSPNPQ